MIKKSATPNFFDLYLKCSKIYAFTSQLIQYKQLENFLFQLALLSRKQAVLKCVIIGFKRVFKRTKYSYEEVQMFKAENLIETDR